MQRVFIPRLIMNKYIRINQRHVVAMFIMHVSLAIAALVVHHACKCGPKSASAELLLTPVADIPLRPRDAARL